MNGPNDWALRLRRRAFVLRSCRDVVVVPTRECMNLAATVNVVLYDRMAKRMPRRVERDEPISALSGMG